MLESQGDATEILKISDLHKSFGQTEVLKGIDLTVRRGETIVILGASGSGKSTLLRCINFLEMPTSGQVYLEGRLIGRKLSGSAGQEKMDYRAGELTRLRAHVGMVFQHFNLFPHMTVIQNVMIAPMKILGVPEAEARDRAFKNLEKVGISAKADGYPSRLSGGQQQRVAIARALAMEPAIILFDEATSALDPELVGEVLNTMRQLSDDGMTMLVVTHELGFAYNVGSRIVFLHEGRIHEQGTPDDVLVRPKQPRTQEFLRSFNLFNLPSREQSGEPVLAAR